MRRIHPLVPECRLDQPLAVVEGPGDRERRHVVAPAGQLLFLPGRHAASRVEDRHASPGPTVECGGDGATCVPRSCHQNGQRSRFVRLRPREVFHALGQEARAEILEGRGGAVEQLEDSGVVAEVLEGHREIERPPAHALEFRRQTVVGQKRLQHAHAERGEPVDRLERGRIETREPFGYEQATVRSQSSQDRRRERRRRGLVSRADELHPVSARPGRRRRGRRHSRGATPTPARPPPGT